MPLTLLQKPVSCKNVWSIKYKDVYQGVSSWLVSLTVIFLMLLKMWGHTIYTFFCHFYHWTIKDKVQSKFIKTYFLYWTEHLQYLWQFHCNTIVFTSIQIMFHFNEKCAYLSSKIAAFSVALINRSARSFVTVNKNQTLAVFKSLYWFSVTVSESIEN
jgi:hypothetical protein